MNMDVIYYEHRNFRDSRGNIQKKNIDGNGREKDGNRREKDGTRPEMDRTTRKSKVGKRRCRK